MKRSSSLLHRLHPGRPAGCGTLMGVLVLVLVCAAPASASTSSTTSSAASPARDGQGSTVRTTHHPGLSGKGLALATLEQCATATAPQSERAVSFAGEMTATSTSARMQMRIALQERASSLDRYRTVNAPGLGSWQSSNAGVKLFTHIQQVTDLSAPAEYRGALEFRWLDAHGHLLKQEDLHTATCVQPAAAETSTPTSATGMQG